MKAICIRCAQPADLPLATCIRCHNEVHGITGCVYCAFGQWPRHPLCTCDNSLRGISSERLYQRETKELTRIAQAHAW